MTATTIRGYTYRVGTDPADIAATSQALATAVDTDITAISTPMLLTTYGDTMVAALLATATITVGTSNRALTVLIRPKNTITPTKFVWWCTVQSGNYDVGIIDGATGNLLWSKGSTACPAAGESVETIAAGPTLTAGTLYGLVFSANNTTLALRGSTLAVTTITTTYSGAVGSGYTATSFPIPATVGARTATTQFPFLALRA